MTRPRGALVRRLVEGAPAVRWHVGRVATDLVYRRVFGALGPGTVIVRPLVLRGTERIELGARCAIYEGVWLACEPDGGPLRIGDDAYLGHHVHIHAADPVRIGARVVLADGVFVGSTDHARDDRHVSAGTGPIEIGDDVFIGQHAVVLGGVRIGAGATVGAWAVVTGDVPAGATVAGVPARALPGGAR